MHCATFYMTGNCGKNFCFPYNRLNVMVYKEKFPAKCLQSAGLNYKFDLFFWK